MSEFNQGDDDVMPAADEMKVYAVHSNGTKLWYPTEKALSSTWVRRGQIAAITIDQNGVTYPPGTFYLLGPNGQPKPGWHRAIELLKNAKNGQNSMVFFAEMP